ncbi:hypothetical protein QKW35_10225 [Pontibacterium granulatum]|uniref:hypothetical protein n=1 Tax=Pontibacterium granulatum TaxID=2036029 RepID=UPI00249C1714|nr:hypothetical protein [Pontibacterium granulatum]MDI3324752.1 hypothetical protein [Pontibacterium granulatum]
MKKFLTSRAERASQAFGTLRSKGANMAKATGTALAAGAAFVGTEVMALTTDQNAQITAAYDATGTSVNLVIAGLLAVVLLLTGFGIIYMLLKR